MAYLETDLVYSNNTDSSVFPLRRPFQWCSNTKCSSDIKITVLLERNAAIKKMFLKSQINTVKMKDNVTVGRDIYELFTVCFDLRIKHMN